MSFVKNKNWNYWGKTPDILIVWLEFRWLKVLKDKVFDEV